MRNQSKRRSHDTSRAVAWTSNGHRNLWVGVDKFCGLALRVIGVHATFKLFLRFLTAGFSSAIGLAQLRVIMSSGLTWRKRISAAVLRIWTFMSVQLPPKGGGSK
jgi:hypothetical protein